MEPLMPLDPTSKLANNMSKENHDAHFDKYWVVGSQFETRTRNTYIMQPKSFDTVAKVKQFVGHIKGYCKRDGLVYDYEVFYGKKMNISVDTPQDKKSKEDHLGNNFDTTA